MESSTLPDGKVISATSDIVAVASHVDNDHGTIDVVENGVKVKRCSIYPNLSCEDHMRTSEVGKAYLKGRFAAPVSIWCDPTGKEIIRKHGFRQPDAFLGDIKEALGKVTGARISKADYESQAVPLDEAEIALSNGKYRAAIDGFTKASKGNIESLRKSAESALAGIAKTGENLLARGKAALEGGRKDKAKELLMLVAGDFEALECGRRAAELVTGLETSSK